METEVAALLQSYTIRICKTAPLILHFEILRSGIGMSTEIYAGGYDGDG